MCLRKGETVWEGPPRQKFEKAQLRWSCLRERGWVEEHILLEPRMTCPQPELSATTQKDCIMSFSAMDKWGDSALIFSLSPSLTLKVKGII